VYVYQNFLRHSTSNPKCHAMFKKTRANVNRHLHFLLKRHIIVTWLAVRVTPISSSSIGVGCFLLLHMSHYISNSKPCVCQMSKTCKDVVTHTHTHTHTQLSIVLTIERRMASNVGHIIQAHRNTCNPRSPFHNSEVLSYIYIYIYIYIYTHHSNRSPNQDKWLHKAHRPYYMLPHIPTILYTSSAIAMVSKNTLYIYKYTHESIVRRGFRVRGHMEASPSSPYRQLMSVGFPWGPTNVGPLSFAWGLGCFQYPPKQWKQIWVGPTMEIK
jgi:hypothetical protein